MALILLCLLAISSTLAVGNPIKYKPCEGIKTYANVSSVDIDPCPKEPCVLHKGGTVKATIKFIPSVDVYGGELETWVTFPNIHWKIKVPKQLPYPCTGHGVVCPLYAGKEYTLFTTLEIKNFYPSGKLLVQNDFRLLDGKYLACYKFNPVIENTETDYAVMDALELTPAREI